MRILLTGASGQLGVYLLDRLAESAHEVVAWSGRQVGSRGKVDLRPIDLSDPETFGPALDRVKPDAILHVAALSSAESVRLDPSRAQAVNVEATARMADWADRHSRRILFTSTDLVFGGSRPWNSEDDQAEPIMAYGQIKRLAELPILTVSGGLVARLSLLYGPSRSDAASFFDREIAAIRRGETRSFFKDEFRTPLGLVTAAEILVRLLESDFTGLCHVGGSERVSRYELMKRSAASLGLDPNLVRPGLRGDIASAEPRPADVSLDTSRLASILPDLIRPGIGEGLFGSSSSE